MAILSTLAELAEYFKGWHTKYYDELHKGLPPADHANAKATKTKYGHVKLTDQISSECYDGSDTTKDSYALCPKAGYDLKNTLNNSINANTRRIEALEQHLYNAEPVKIKIGKIREYFNGNPITNDFLNTYITTSNPIDNYMNEVGEWSANTFGEWGATKLMMDAPLQRPVPRITVKILDKDGNALPNVNVWIRMHEIWYPRVTNKLGYVFLNLNLHNVDNFSKYSPNSQEYKNLIKYNAIDWGDTWHIMDVFANVSGSVSNLHGVYNSISKKFLVNVGQNLWHLAMNDPATFTEIQNVPTYHTNLSTNNLDEYKIVYNGKTIGYKIYDDETKQFYRYPRESYPYGRILSSDMADVKTILRGV